MKILSYLLAIVLLISGTCWADIVQAQSEKSVVVGIDINLKPFSFKDGAEKYVGFDIDIWQTLADDIGLAYEFKPMDFEQIIPALQNGFIDVAIAAITITSQREKVIDFSYPYFDSGLSVMVRADREGIYGIGTLDDKVIATKNGTTSAEFSQSILSRKVLLFPDIEMAYRAVLSGAADAAIYDAPALLYYIKIKGEGKLKSVGPRYQRQSYGIAFPQGSPLREQVNQELLKLIEIGRYDIISRKWFGNVD